MREIVRSSDLAEAECAVQVLSEVKICALLNAREDDIFRTS